MKGHHLVAFYFCFSASTNQWDCFNEPHRGCSLLRSRTPTLGL